MTLVSGKEALDLIHITRRLSRSVSALHFAEPVTHVYNPLEYARAPTELFIERYARLGIEALFLGMNPGPWGMAQTGIPFGEVELARDWLGVEAPVQKPRNEHPKRPIEGFACARSEVSGRRLWGWARERFGKPEAFFQRFFVWNFCPLVFMEESGRNRTPDKLPRAEAEPLFSACDDSLRQAIEALQPACIIGVGKFAQTQALRIVGDSLPVHTILHPSPASPIANRGWAPQAEAQLAALGFALPGSRRRKA